MVLKWNSNLSPSNDQAVCWEQPYAKAIEEATGGRVKIEFYWSEALGKAKEGHDIIKNNLGQMTRFPSTYLAGRFPLLEVGNLPWAVVDSYNLVKAYDALIAKGYFDKEWNEVELLGIAPITGYDFLLREKKPMTFEELAGLKVRSPGGYYSAYLEAIGCIPVKVLTGEAFTAYERGLVDAQCHTPGFLWVQKLHEAKTRAILKIGFARYSSSAIIVNKDVWASMPPDLQKIMRETAREWGDKFVDCYLAMDEPAYDNYRNVGVEVYSLPEADMDKLQARAFQVWEQYISENEAKGHPARQIVTEFTNELRRLGENPPWPGK